MKVFKILHSSELPVISLRDPNYIYFLYDKLTLFDGQNLFYDHFVIAEEMPTEPVERMWYICFDGYIRSLIDYQIQKIAYIEDESMLNLLYKAGTIFFYEARRRYLDTRRQLIELPYLNGSYQMTTHLANNIILDENTVIAFNPETSEFEISGKPQDYDLIFTHDYKGIDTKTVSTDVTDHEITTEIKISNKYDNIIRVVEDGLFASVVDRVTIEEYEDLKEKFTLYKYNLEDFIESITDEIEQAAEIVSPEAISARILSLLEDKYSTIEYALEQLNSMSAKFPGIESRCKEYTDETVGRSTLILTQMVNDATENPWENFGENNPIS